MKALVEGGPSEYRSAFQRGLDHDPSAGGGGVEWSNREARIIILAMVYTGAGPSEVAALPTEHILLTAKLAYTDILFDGANSSRSIPRSRRT